MKNSNFTQSIFCLILFLVSGNAVLYSQQLWEEIATEPRQICEDIAILEDGKFYFSVKDRNIIMESDDFGESWRNIVQDSFLFVPWEHSKSLYASKREGLIEFFNYRGFNFGRKYDPSTGLEPFPKSYDKIYNGLEADLDGNYFGYSFSEVYTFTKNWSEIKDLIKVETVVKLFTHFRNFIYVLIDSNGVYSLLKVDSKTGAIISSSYLDGILSEDYVLLPAEDMVYWGTRYGLVLLDMKQNTGTLVEIKSNSSNDSRIDYMYRSLRGDMIIIGSREGSFASNGLNSPWIQLHVFGKNIPDTVIKMIVYDTTTAMLIQNVDYCGHLQAYLLNKNKPEWKNCRSLLMHRI
ncbi:MAG TPA: hypothetical protein PK006_01415 [Saprospiraceae bacterium]|nr:hypothetical protein [Saprospiraceae bacterium]